MLRRWVFVGLICRFMLVGELVAHCWFICWFYCAYQTLVWVRCTPSLPVGRFTHMSWTSVTAMCTIYTCRFICRGREVVGLAVGISVGLFVGLQLVLLWVYVLVFQWV